ncbi:hypothetical protein L226DRAFT_541130 [Lentinus tigrinus ALCF2SS1-7]|uniref:Uncharacterized protein n=1 Tax=Lentinus tigrinus ALCF2SS1-6 TaxID=1328759 RepID=A0A5C2RNC6_9APHY|nr:hypothetical protein L227DRAFT_658798 [Lentinus tigrinus ALCF2SS1-6]RPD67926.1 hypothetical protein L226DRAFT_541130 [Lentinus tigrinus ALCF2SS1-7]
MPEQGRLGLIGTHQQPLDNLRALAPDSNSKTHVYLLVYADDDDSRYWHWSIGWQVGGGRGQPKAWRHIHIQVHRVPVVAGPGLPPMEEKRYVYWGGLTKAEGALTTSARKISLGKMTLAMRVRIEELAMTVPVMRMGVGAHWNCQDWVRELAAKMVVERLIDRRTLEDAMVDACRPLGGGRRW